MFIASGFCGETANKMTKTACLYECIDFFSSHLVDNEGLNDDVATFATNAT